jgi:flagellar hook protein FlgE
MVILDTGNALARNTPSIACVATHAGADAGSSAPATPNASPTPAAATTGITIRGNLDQTAYPTTFDPDNMQNTTNFNTSTTIYDSLGSAIQIEICFCKNDIASTQTSDSGDWTYHVTTAPQNLASAGDGTTPDLSCRPAEIATGTTRRPYSIRRDLRDQLHRRTVHVAPMAACELLRRRRGLAVAVVPRASR